MEEISEVDAKANFETLLDRVEQGGELVITRDGKPVARLTAAFDAQRAAEGVAELQQLRSEIAARGGLMSWSEMKELRDEGRP